MVMNKRQQYSRGGWLLPLHYQRTFCLFSWNRATNAKLVLYINLQVTKGASEERKSVILSASCREQSSISVLDTREVHGGDLLP